jgi:hypothetical protein
VAFLRHLPGQDVLVIANLAREPVAAPALSLDGGPLCGAPSAHVVLGAGDATAPVIGASGGFDGYVPLVQLGPRAVVVIELGR